MCLQRPAKVILALLGCGVLALIVTFLLAGISISGVTSMTAANVFLWIDFIVFSLVLLAVGVLFLGNLSGWRSALAGALFVLLILGVWRGRSELLRWLVSQKALKQTASGIADPPAPVPPKSIQPAPVQPKPLSTTRASAKSSPHQNQPPAAIPPGSTQTCVGSNCVLGTNYGPQILNEFGAPKLVMTDAQRDAIEDGMKPYAGVKFSILRHNVTEDSGKYADQLKNALTNAGLLCVLDRNGMKILEPPVPAGISVQVGRDDLRAADSLGTALKAVGLISGRLTAWQDPVKPDAFEIIVAPNR